MKAPTSVNISHDKAVQHDHVDMNSDDESDTKDESESDTEDLLNENQDLLKIINNIISTFNYSLQLRKKF